MKVCCLLSDTVHRKALAHNNLQLIRSITLWQLRQVALAVLAQKENTNTPGIWADGNRKFLIPVVREVVAFGAGSAPFALN
jgi:hypothetical protein